MFFLTQKVKNKIKDSDGKEEETTRGLVKTGDPEVDNHLSPSTLGGETAELVDKFRQLKFKEYNDILNLCQEKKVVLSEKLLKRGGYNVTHMSPET